MILKRGHPQLSLKARKATAEDVPALLKLEEALRGAYESLPKGSAAAIASSQIVLPDGVELIAAFYAPKLIKGSNDFFVNPTWTPIKPDMMSHEECLSDPGHTHSVIRWSGVRVEYDTIIYDDNLWPESRILHGFGAFVFQHEVDHLDGITIFSNLLHDVSEGNNQS